MRGLDPRIHLLRKKLFKRMDCRVKPGNDERKNSGNEMSEAAAVVKDEKEADHLPYRRPVDAATLILIDRTGPVPKVLVGKRHDKVVFMPGKFVFPGGRVEALDN